MAVEKQVREKIKSFSCFAGTMLTLIPIISCFLSEVIDEGHELLEHRQCFELLEAIVGICFMGSDDAVQHSVLLQKLIGRYITLFAKLYPTAAVPKLHQLLHLTDNIAYLQKLLSCFVTERKHRSTKRAALFVFRHIDNTVIKDLVNRMCDSVVHNKNCLFTPEFLVSPKQIQFGEYVLQRAKQALLKCGQIREKDLVYLTTGIVAKVKCFWQHIDQTHICVQAQAYSNVGYRRWDETDEIIIVDSDNIIDSVIWSKSGNFVYVIPPFRVQLASWYR